MKKVFLTVLTVVLFSVSGWANTVQLESEKDINLNFLLNNDCYHCIAQADALDDGSDRTNRTWMKNVDACRVSSGCDQDYQDQIGSVKKPSLSIN